MKRSPPDKNVNTDGFNIINRPPQQQAVPTCTLNKVTSASLTDLDIFSTPVAAPSNVNPRKRRQLLLSPDSNPVNHSTQLEEILTYVKSCERKINDLNLNMIQIVSDNSELKKEILRISDLHESLKLEVVALNSQSKKQFNELKSKNSSTSIVDFPLMAKINQDINLEMPSHSATLASSQLSFADKLKQPPAKRNPVLVVKPKDKSQKSETTMSVIKTKITPTKLKVQKVKHTRDGGIAIECGSKEAIQNIKSSAESVLGTSYIVTAPEKRLPRIKVIGLSEIKAADVIELDLLGQNEEIFTSESKISISECFEVRSKYGFRMEIDPGTFNRLMMDERKRLRIGWDLCTVFEAFSTIRCYKCWRFHHTLQPRSAKQINQYAVDAVVTI